MSIGTNDMISNKKLPLNVSVAVSNPEITEFLRSCVLPRRHPRLQINIRHIFELINFVIQMPKIQIDPNSQLNRLTLIEISEK